MRKNEQGQPFLVISNFLPPQENRLFPALLANNPPPNDIGLLPLWMGDLVLVFAQNGTWCYGRRLEEPENFGLFPNSYIREIPAYFGQNKSKLSDPDDLAMEIAMAVKAWWKGTKIGIANGESPLGQSEQQMLLIKQLMTLWRSLRSGTVPAEELKELRLTVANVIDAGNCEMCLPMHIRDQQGRPIQTQDLSATEAYRKHEETSQRMKAQSAHILDPSVEDKLARSGDGPSEWTLLLTVDHSDLVRASGQNAELVLGLGKTMRPKESQQATLSRATRPLSEPLTIRLPTKSPSRAVFIGLKDSDLNDSVHSLSLWMTALRWAPLVTEKGQRKGEEVRQFFAHGQADLCEVVREMADKEQRELTLLLARKNAICESSEEAGYIPSSCPPKIAVTLTVQLFAAHREEPHASSPDFRLIQQLRNLKTGSNSPRDLKRAECRRNEVFIWLRDGDFHGIGRSEKNIEAVISVVDDEGVFQPEAIEIVTPDGPIRESSFRCRVWPAEDRPRFNELVKVLLPEQEVRNLHLQVLFYNKSANDNKKLFPSGTSSSSAKGPFALAFLCLLHNFVLCPDDEDELFIYRLEKGKTTDLARAFNVAYLTNLAKRKEMRQPKLGMQQLPSVGGRSSSVATLPGALDLAQLQQQSGGGMYSLCERNGLHFQSFVCSQTYSQSQTLVQILRWQENEQHLLRLRLLELSQNDLAKLHEELAKFLPNLLDALFQIAEAHSQLQGPVFDVLVHIHRLAEDSSQTGQLGPMLEEFIMHFPHAHNFLLEHLIWYVANEPAGGSSGEHRPWASPSSPSILQYRPSIPSRDRTLLVLKSLGFLIRLALASKLCATFLEKQQIVGRREGLGQDEQQQHFLHQLDSLRSALLLLLASSAHQTASQSAAIEQLPSLLVPLLEYAIYKPLELANFVKEVLDSLSELEGATLLRQKLLLFIGQIIASQLFASQECRRVLLDRFLAELLAQMPPHVRQVQRKESVHSSCSDSASANCQLECVQLSAKILGDLLDRLFPYSRKQPVDQLGSAEELALILAKCLRPLNQTMITLLGDPVHQRTLHALLLAILDKFSAQHFASFFARMCRPLDRMDALCEMLHMFRDLMLRCPVPPEWVQIRRLQSRLFLKHIRFASGYVRREFASGEKFDQQLWSECMFSCVAFAQWASAGDGEEEEERAREMRQFAAKMLRSLWHSLSPMAKFQMIPEMVGPVMEVALCEHEQLRELAVPLFFDMLVTEHWLTAKPKPSVPSGGVVLRKTQQQQMAEAMGGNGRFGEEFISRLDEALDTVEEERTFADFRRAFNRTFEQLPKNSGREATPLRIFVERVNKLLELFSAYLSVAKLDGLLEMGMFSTVQLVDFYQQIGQNVLYLVYLYKLYTLHISAGNWVEAALTLQRHAKLLEWTDERPVSWLYGARKENYAFGTQLELKEHLYREMAELFTKGGHWELAIEMNKELGQVYEEILFDYAKMASLLETNANLYRKVTREIRLECNYFFVAFYGRDCPAYLANRKFIFRGEQLELWGDFKQRMLNNFSDYKFIDSMDDCDELMGDVGGKFVQIIAVSPLPSAAFTSLLQSPSRLASWYFKNHKIQRFEFVRREFRNETKWTALEDTETMRLWLRKKIVGIERPLPDLLSFGPVISEQAGQPMNPVEVAIEKVREANDKLADLAGRVSEGFGQFLMNLGGMVRGIVQADVGGGINNFQPFFSAECLLQCSEEEKRLVEQLRALILEQVTLLEFALFVHAGTDQARANAHFHNFLVDSFEQHRTRLEARLGLQAKSILPEGAAIYLAEQQHQPNQASKPGPIGPAPGESRLHSATASALAIPISNSFGSKSGRSQSLNESQHRLMQGPPSSSPSSSAQILRPPSAASQSNSSGSSGSNTASALFRNSPFGAAHSLIRTTIQGKAKQKLQQRKNSKKLVHPGEEASAAPPPGPSSSQLLSAAISQTRASDSSMENCFLLLESSPLAPPLPPRESKLHSEKLIIRPGRREDIC